MVDPSLDTGADARSSESGCGSTPNAMGALSRDAGDSAAESAVPPTKGMEGGVGAFVPGE